jgi:hypothetical protein
VLIKESTRLEESYRTARDKAEKKYGKWILAPKPGEWPGETIVSPFYDRWCRAGNAKWMAALRMARTKPTTLAGASAMIDHIRCEIAACSESVEDWVTIALKTAASSLARMSARRSAFAIAP